MPAVALILSADGRHGGESPPSLFPGPTRPGSREKVIAVNLEREGTLYLRVRSKLFYESNPRLT